VARAVQRAPAGQVPAGERRAELVAVRCCSASCASGHAAPPTRATLSGMNFETIQVTVQTPGGMDWNSLLSALLGGLFALGGVVLTQAWTDRNQRKERVDNLVGECLATSINVSGYMGAAAGQMPPDLGPRFARDLMALQAHVKRWDKKRSRLKPWGRKRHKVRRGFAVTTRALWGEISKHAPGPGTDQKQVNAWMRAVNGMKAACVLWEEDPETFASGDRSKDLLSGELVPQLATV
jgi:hypothetical protein